MSFCSAANVGLSHPIHLDRSHQPRVTPDIFQSILQGQSIDDRRKHTHVVGRCFLNTAAGSNELTATQDVAAADDDGDLATTVGRLLHLLGDVHHFVHGDATFSGWGKALTG